MKNTTSSLTDSLTMFVTDFQLRVDNQVFFPISYFSVPLPCIQLRYLKNLKLFSIKVKELFEPIVLHKKATGFCSF